MSIEFNSSVNIANVAKQYQVDKRTRILDVLVPENAGQLAMSIHDNVPFETTYVLDGEFKTSSYDELNGMQQSELNMLMHKIYGEASKGIGFYYGRYVVNNNKVNDAIVQQAFDFLNSPSTLNAIKQISGCDDIVAASAQVTRYYPGNFLTRHNDVNTNEERRVAYVLNVTPEWHPDWGGLLQFYQQDGTPRDAWAPTFNSMALFDVNHVHAVTYVAPFAKKPRLSITGWFRAKPL